MELLNALTHLRDEGITSLDIYWLEQNGPDDEYWWCDIIVDKLNTLRTTEWTWTVMSQLSREEYENDDCQTGFSPEEDWFIVVDEEKFSDDLMGTVIRTWLRDHGFDFEVNVVTPGGSIEMEQMLALWISS